MNVEIILLALSPVFMLFVSIEYIKYRENYDIKDSLTNALLAVLHQGSDALALLILMPFFNWLHQFAIVEISLNIVTLFIAFILQDFLYYWFHRASHHLHLLWASHVVHHSSTHMNFSTAFRQSLMYPITGMWIFWLPMILVGFDPKTVFIIVALNLAFQFFVHTKIVKKMGWVERIFNTPSHHRVHHAVNKAYLDKNFAGVLIVWDKIFGTYIDENEEVHGPCRFGIIGQITTCNPLVILFHQWTHLLKNVWVKKGLVAKWHVIFGYPTSSINKSKD